MLTTRAMTAADVPACVAILNHIIALGGSTAYDHPYSEDFFASEYLDEAPVANVAVADGRIVGFQAAFDYGEGLYSIGSFTDRENPVKGAGRALFNKTLADCRVRGGVAILARITSDNAGGLAFYSRIGFVDDHVVPDDHTRPDGTRVDRIVKRYAL
ncbi:GNAT family N-acetyltransferase [Pseudaestuariivita atlantica]|uniref:N-acetyltransferase domain-containing protein n=1 Tax=Pseudaestuariivita atlantica TaxID=1317121 RepID=A0A0L1JPI1_9RHOB|nr:GNAT family N-acetyltransferase [Pseudaestuariivita atlantica]KNG93622.1 hypothetical protein ATO11_10460 [Pseudaestuariivita atlantica]